MCDAIIYEDIQHRSHLQHFEVISNKQLKNTDVRELSMPPPDLLDTYKWKS